MVLPAQFQLGLELTNIVNPISQAVSALGSLALVDAIKKSGSDALTETKLASFIGRHRIDSIIELHFQKAVAKADQHIISRYIDIILEAGAGPTVQQALKNPALFSMVIQLSGLAFAHEDQSLAYAIVQAIEVIVRESGSDVAIVPEYDSLLGTLRACQAQTVAFQWAPIYEAVEHKIQQALKALANEQSQTEGVAVPLIATTECVDRRCLPFPVLQALLMWLQSLQNSQDQRLLHLRCDRGVSTIVVWCYHILGLSVKVVLEETTISFGEGPSVILVEQTSIPQVEASLMEPADEHEPLFTLTSNQDNVYMGYENRAEAYGFGYKILKMKIPGMTVAEGQHYSEWVICQAILSPESFVYSDGDYPSEHRVIRAGQFMFGLGQVYEASVRRPRGSNTLEAPAVLRKIWTGLVALLIAFARIPEHDLEMCMSMPLSLSAYHALASSPKLATRPDLLTSWGYVSRLLLGHMYSPDYVATAVLVSAWGWSIFFDCIDVIDPAEVSNTVRVMCGVPSRRGVRAARVIDGPTESEFSSALDRKVSDWPQINFHPGLSSAIPGVPMVGQRPHALQVIQNFTWTSYTHPVQKIKFGFRQMQEMRHKVRKLPPCQCATISSDTVEQLDASTFSFNDATRLSGDEGSTHSGAVLHQNMEILWPRSRADRTISSERVVARSIDGSLQVCFFYVSGSAAARWLQLFHMVQPQRDGFPNLFIRGMDTCIKCAMSYDVIDRNNVTRILL